MIEIMKVCDPITGAKMLSEGYRIPMEVWSEPLFVGEETLQAARNNVIMRGSFVRYLVFNYHVLDIVLGVTDNGWIAVMSGGYLNNPSLPLQFASKI